MKFKPANSHSGRTEMVIALLVGLTVIGAAALATPAHAAANCAPGFHCLFAAGGLEKYQFFNSVRDFSSIITHDGRSPNNNSVAASNASTSGIESHYYDLPNFVGFLFCVSPGATVSIPSDLQNRASSLLLRSPTTIHCLGS